MKRWWIIVVVALVFLAGASRAEGETDDSDAAAQAIPTAEDDLGKSKEGSRTDDEVIEREEEAIKIDGLNASQVKELREQAEKHQFEAEVSRMMKLIINSLYRNKEIFLRELISNASDALDKIRFLSLTDSSVLTGTEQLTIKIKADKENHVIHVMDTGIGMTKEELVKNLGTIAKSGTSEFISKMTHASTDMTLQGDLIGQFGVGFYSSFLVADTVVVTSKNNDDEQYIWESNAGEFSVSKDPRGNTLGRGTHISLYLKEEAYDFAEPDTLKNLIKKYSQFINFNIYLWTSKTEEVEEPIEDDEEEPSEEKKDDDDASVEEEKPEKPKTKKVEKTTWDWELINTDKPLWTRKPKEIDDKEYNDFYKSFSKESEPPLAKIHFVAEGEVTFRSILFVPKAPPMGYYQDASKRMPSVKLYVRRVFITDEFEDLMPRYLGFIKGLVDSDDLPLNVSRETLQQHKLLKVIRKKLVRKALDMIKKIDPEQYKEFWKEFGTSIKMGIIEDHSNRTRLAKLLRFQSSNHKEGLTTLLEYVERMKDKQEHIYYIAGVNREELQASPFVERLLKKGYEVIYLVDTVDEYAVQSLPEFEGKKFQNVAKDGLSLGDETEKTKKTQQAIEKKFKPLTDWLQEKPLKENIEKAVISKRLADSPCALVASQFGWSGNMERIMAAQAQGGQRDNYYFNQKKILEINPRHPLIKKLLTSVEENPDDTKAKDMAEVLYETAILRSGYALKDTSAFAGRVERMLRLSMNVDLDEQVEEEVEEEAEEEEEEVAGDDSDSDGAAESDDSADDIVKADEDAAEPAPTSEDPDADTAAEDTGDGSKDEL